MTTGALAGTVRPGRAPGARSLSVCKVWIGEYPWDVRVEKVARALTAAGHRVHLVARNRTRLATTEQLPEATVHRLASWRGAPGWLNAASMFPAFFNPRWIRAILLTARRSNADVILCRDLPLAASAILVGRHIGLPVVLDMAENYPAMLRDRWDVGRMRPLDVLVRNPRFALALERWVLRRSDHVLTVVEEARAYVIARGVPPHRVTIVSNTPPLDQLAPLRRTAAGGRGEVQLAYLGRMEEPRGVRVLLQAAALLATRSFPFRLTLFGDGKDVSDFHACARDLGLSRPQVDFRGRVPNAEALAALPNADIGIIPHFASESWNTTIPNKLFDYMAAGLAVVTSDAKPAERIVRETGAGLVYRDRDAADLARAIEVLADPARRLDCARRGQAAVRQAYNAERDAERLLAALQQAVASHRRSGRREKA